MPVRGGEVRMWVVSSGSLRSFERGISWGGPVNGGGMFVSMLWVILVRCWTTTSRNEVRMK